MVKITEFGATAATRRIGRGRAAVLVEASGFMDHVRKQGRKVLCRSRETHSRPRHPAPMTLAD
jgi:hypothetical protein